DLRRVFRLVARNRPRHAERLAVAALAAFPGRNPLSSAGRGAPPGAEVRSGLPGLRDPHRAVRPTLMGLPRLTGRAWGRITGARVRKGFLETSRAFLAFARPALPRKPIKVRVPAVGRPIKLA